MSTFHFKFMSFFFKFRDKAHPPEEILKEVEIKEGFKVLDYGCGPGSYTIIAAGLAGKSGKIYAVDIEPEALKQVLKKEEKKGYTNIETILTDCNTDLPDKSIDVILFYDTLHDLKEPENVLKELNRILKPEGVMSFSDHHMKEDAITSKVTETGLFKLSRKGTKTYTFTKG